MPKPREATNSSACTFVLRFVNSFATRPHSSLDNYYGQQLGSIINIMYLVLRRFRKEIINDEINAFVFCTLLRSLFYKKNVLFKQIVFSILVEFFLAESLCFGRTTKK